MNHSGVGTTIGYNEISLPVDLLQPLSIIEGVSVWGIYYPDREKLDANHGFHHDLIISPIPFVLWGKTARVVVHVKHDHGSFERISETIYSENASILVSEASKSGYHYDTWTLIVAFDNMRLGPYSKKHKTFLETKKRIDSLQAALFNNCDSVFFFDKSDVQLRMKASVSPHNAMSFFYNEYLKNKKKAGDANAGDLSWLHFKPFTLTCNEHNTLISKDNDLKIILSGIDNAEKNFMPCNVFATMNTFDRNIRLSLVPKSEYDSIFGCTITFTRTGPPPTSKGVVKNFLNSISDAFNVWNLTNRTEVFTEDGEEGRLDIIMSDPINDKQSKNKREEFIYNRLSRNAGGLPSNIINTNVECYPLGLLAGDMATEMSPSDIADKNENPIYDLFISYSTQNSTEAIHLEGLFKRHNIRCFLSEKRLQPGDTWDDKIKSSLIGSHEVLFLYSPEAKESDWVKQEYGAAWVLDKRITPVMLNCEIKSLPAGLKRLQAEFFHKANDDWSFLNQLKQRISRRPNNALQRTLRFAPRR